MAQVPSRRANNGGFLMGADPGPGIQFLGFDEAWSKADPSHNFAFGFDPAKWDAKGFVALDDLQVVSYDETEPRMAKKGVCGHPLVVDCKGNTRCSDPSCAWTRLKNASEKALGAMRRMAELHYEHACEFCTPKKVAGELYDTLTAINDPRYLGPEVNTPLDGGSNMKKMRYQHADECPIWQLGEARLQLKSVRVGIPI